MRESASRSNDMTRGTSACIAMTQAVCRRFSTVPNNSTCKDREPSVSNTEANKVKSTRPYLGPNDCSRSVNPLTSARLESRISGSVALSVSVRDRVGGA